MSKFAFVALVLALAAPAHADSFTFSDIANGGVGSATMDVTIAGNTLTAVVDNTSPILQLDGVTQNISAITAFGFDLNPDTLGLNSWTLTAKLSDGTTATIGDGTASKAWSMVTFVDGVTLDYIGDTGNDDRLYNPALAGALGDMTGSNRNAYTTATLVMNFDAAPTLVALPRTTGNDKYPGSPWIRMQSVGNGGSVKIPGTPNDNPPVPEPGTLVLVGLGAAGYVIARRRKRA